MKTVAIICEYDPFHRGHKHQIELIRKQFGSDTTVISLMSGSTVQRGRLSVYPKHMRAEAAVKCGSDLILELPCPYSCSSAEYFAAGAVKLLCALGGIDTLVFGSECGSLDELTDTAKIIGSEQYKNAVKENGRDLSHIRTSEEIFCSLGGKAFPSSPNDILGAEYLSALIKNKSSIIPYTYKRENGWSATKSRILISQGCDPSEMIPDKAMDVFGLSVPTDQSIYSSIALHVIRSTPSDILSEYFGMNGGVSGLIKSRADEVTDVDDLIAKCTGKSYTSSRIRRAILSSVLKITETDAKAEPKFTNLLAASEKGREYLKGIKKTARIEIVTKPADRELLSTPAKEAFDISLRSDRLMSLCRKESPSQIFKRSPFIVK